MMGKKGKFLGLIIIFALIVSLAAACSEKNNNAGGDNAGTAPQQLTKLTLGYLNVMDDAQTILAWRAGLYEKHGIDADMKMFSSGTDLIKAMVGGQVDAGVLGFTNGLSWLQQGSDLKIIGGAQMGYHALLVQEDSGIDTVDQLRGKSIASQKAGSTADVVWNGVVLKSGGLTRQDVTMQGVSPAVAIQSLAAEQVDAAFVFEPYSSIAKISYPVKEIYEIGNEWPFPCMVVIATGDIVKNNRDAVHRMLDAQKEAIEMLTNEPAKAAAFIKNDFIQEDTVKTLDGSEVPAVEVIQAAIESQEFKWVLDEDDINKMKEIGKFMVEQGILDAEPDVDAALDLTWQNALN